MRELFKTPFGSRLYGTFTESSDYDWKIVHLPELRDLLIHNDGFKNKFYSTSSKEYKNTSDDTDTEYIALQTLARDVIKGQAYAIEVAFAIKQMHRIDGAEVYGSQVLHIVDETPVCDHEIRHFVNELLEFYLTSQMSGMVGYAYHQAKLYSAKGDRLNFLRDVQDVLLDAIANGQGDTTIHNLTTNETRVGWDFRSALVELEKQHPEWFEYKAIHIDETKNKYYSLKLFKKTYLGTSKILHVSRILDKAIAAYGSRANQAAINEGHDWKALSHAVRVTYQAIELLEQCTLSLPLRSEYVAVLKAIKAGSVDFDKVQALLEANVDLIDSLKETTELPEYTEELMEEFEEWLKEWMVYMYQIRDAEDYMIE